MIEGDRGIVLTRTVGAPRDLVWRAWTEPEQIARWWGPNGYSITVHEMDVRRVKLGQKASITSDAFDTPVTGVVDEIGALIYKNDVLDVDPRANTDSRVIEVRIKVDSSAAVASFTNLETHVRIELPAAAGATDGKRP